MKPYYQDDAVIIFHGDCREILPNLEPVDLVLTDPPYGTGWVRGGGNDPTGGPHPFKAYTVKAEWDVWSTDWIGDRRCAFFLPNSRLKEMQPHCRSFLWWKKTNPRPGGPEKEPIGLTHDDVTGEFEYYNGDIEFHPCQKPPPLMRWILRQLNAQTILDPFMGSGTTLRAAKDLGRKAIGIEIEEKYCEIAARRMAQEVLNLAV